MSNLTHIPQEFRNEFSVSADGTVTASQRAVARLCGVSDSSVRGLLKKIKQGARLEGVQTLRTLVGQDFEGARLDAKVAGCIVNYYAHEAGRYKTEQALAVALTFSVMGFEHWVHLELGWKPGNPSTAHAKARLEGIETRKTLTDAIKGYIDRHPELSENAITFLYSNTTDALYLRTHGQRAHKLVEALQCPKGDLRSNMSAAELKVLGIIEDIAIRLIEARDMHPIEAVKDAVSRSLTDGVFIPEGETKQLP